MENILRPPPATDLSPNVVVRIPSDERALRSRSSLAGVWAFRWLLLQWSRRDFTVQYKQSLLGVVWAVVQPLMLLALYGVIFTAFLGVKPDRGSYAVFALCGLVPWSFISSAIGRSSGSILGGAGLMRQVYFPRAIIPLASTGVTVIDLAIATVVLLGAQLVTAGTVHLSTLSLVPIYFGLILFMSGVSIFVSVIGALVRDIRFLIPLLLQVGFLATPIMYPRRGTVPGKYGWIYAVNPVARTIESIRQAVIDGTWPPAYGLLLLVAVGALTLVVALRYSAAVEERLPDLL
jgi:lipopolysaccharide transport system permease protein